MWIRCGFGVDSVWIRCGVGVDSVWIRCGLSVVPGALGTDTVWMMCGRAWHQPSKPSTHQRCMRARARRSLACSLLCQARYPLPNMAGALPTSQYGRRATHSRTATTWSVASAPLSRVKHSLCCSTPPRSWWSRVACPTSIVTPRCIRIPPIPTAPSASYLHAICIQSPLNLSAISPIPALGRNPPADSGRPFRG